MQTGGTENWLSLFIVYCSYLGIAVVTQLANPHSYGPNGIEYLGQ